MAEEKEQPKKKPDAKAAAAEGKAETKKPAERPAKKKKVVRDVNFARADVHHHQADCGGRQEYRLLH